MPLIDIIQLVLIGFILISLVIFLFSYIAYRTKNKNLSYSAEQFIPIKSIKENKGFSSEEKENSTASKDISPDTDKNKTVNKKRFEVFKTSSWNKSHFPRTISSSISKESQLKKGNKT